MGFSRGDSLARIRVCRSLLLPFEMNRIRIICRSPNNLGVLAEILRNYIPMLVDSNNEMSIRANLLKFE